MRPARALYFYRITKQKNLQKVAFEIERKFLVKGEFRNEAGKTFRIIQGYLSSVPERTVRIRLKGERGFITVKGSGNESGTTRFEWEREISFTEAEELLKICEPGIIEKIRYEVRYGGHLFEIDEFTGENEGLVIAEVELASENEHFEVPGWLDREITGERPYYNSSLKDNPFSRW
jgi:adenylate cyclase